MKSNIKWRRKRRRRSDDVWDDSSTRFAIHRRKPTFWPLLFDCVFLFFFSCSTICSHLIHHKKKINIKDGCSRMIQRIERMLRNISSYSTDCVLFVCIEYLLLFNCKTSLNIFIFHWTAKKKISFPHAYHINAYPIEINDVEHTFCINIDLNTHFTYLLILLISKHAS